MTVATQIALWEMPDGRILEWTVALKSRKQDDSGTFLETEEECFNRQLTAYEQKPSSWARGARRIGIKQRNELPSERFRNCWRDSGDGTVKEDMPLARAQRLAEIRAERDRRFPPLDNEWMKATGQGNKTRAAAVEGVRQQLRDIPNKLIADGSLEGIATPEELEAFDPEWPDV